MIDTHAHIQLADYDHDRTNVVEHARAQGVTAIVCIGSNRENSQGAAQCSKEFGDVYYTVGIHPRDGEDDLSMVEARSWLQKQLQAKDRKVVAIGECGLDYNQDDISEAEKNRQKELFRLQLEMAHQYDLPVVFHINKAYDELISILQNENEEGRIYRGVFHFYTGGKKRVERLLSLGDFYFGIGGAATYDQGLQEVLRYLPLDRIVLETDCPYVAPVPHRGERSEPAYVIHVAEMVSAIHGASLAKVEEVTDRSARNLFAIT